MIIIIKKIIKKLLNRIGYTIFSLNQVDAFLEERDNKRKRDNLEAIIKLRESNIKERVVSNKFFSCEIVSSDVFFKVALKKIQAVDSLLEIGCGINPQIIIPCDLHICCEPHSEYRDICIQKYLLDKNKIFLSADIKLACDIFSESTVDTVYLFDIIEHVDKNLALQVLEKMKRIAKKQIVLFTPVGFMPQHFDSDEGLDQWGLHGRYWQEHRSGWTSEDFKSEGWQVVICNDFHRHDVHGNVFDNPMGAMWAIWTR